MTRNAWQALEAPPAGERNTYVIGDKMVRASARKTIVEDLTRMTASVPGDSEDRETGRGGGGGGREGATARGGRRWLMGVGGEPGPSPPQVLTPLTFVDPAEGMFEAQWRVVQDDVVASLGGGLDNQTPFTVLAYGSPEIGFHSRVGSCTGLCVCRQGAWGRLTESFFFFWIHRERVFLPFLWFLGLSDQCSLTPCPLLSHCRQARTLRCSLPSLPTSTLPPTSTR